MITTVLGLDLSLTATGIAVITHDTVMHIETIASKGTKTDTLYDRHHRLTTIARAIRRVGGAHLAVIEAPLLSPTVTGSTWDRAGLWWITIATLRTAGIPVAEVHNTHVKKFATGSGRGDKTAVGVAMSHLWPQAKARNNNEWDALALAHIGAARLGLPVPARAHHAGVLARITWPDSLVTPDEPMRA